MWNLVVTRVVSAATFLCFSNKENCLKTFLGYFQGKL